MKMNIFKVAAGVALTAIFTFNAMRFMDGPKQSDMSLMKLKSAMAQSGCEDSVKREGGFIITTVCNRKTSALDVLLNVKCGTEATTSCSYSNVG